MIVFDQVSKQFPNGFRAVDRLSLEIGQGETLVLLGTSGSGKTTALKMINRLIEPTEGRMSIDGKDVRELNPFELRRQIGYAIQEIGLFPHMSIGENIAVVPRLLNWAEARIAVRVDELLQLVGLDPAEFRDRFPTQLSGGQRQRIGVARALAADPAIVLMDEPFGALDPITREQLQGEFADLQTRLRKTVVFVTHDIFEAVRLGDRVALLDQGRLQQLDTPANIIEQPANNFVEQFLGTHRFQLALLTRTIRRTIAEGLLQLSHPEGPVPESPAGALIRYRHSVIEALDAFKRARAVELPVLEADTFRGLLSRKSLLGAMAQIIDEAREEAAS